MLWFFFWTIAAITRAPVSSVAAQVVGTESLREKMTRRAEKAGRGRQHDDQHDGS